MKSFPIIFICAFTFLNVAYSQDCDSRGEMGLTRCYIDLFNSIGFESSELSSSDVFKAFGEAIAKIDEETLCEAINKRAKCLGDDYELKCLNIPTLAKVFYISNNDAWYLLYNDFMYQDYCRYSEKGSVKDIECLNDVDFDIECPRKNDGCDNLSVVSLKNVTECDYNIMKKKCGDNDVIQLRYNSESFADKKIAEICKL